MNGNCEVEPEMPCVWIQAWERSKLMPRYGQEIMNILPPRNNQLDGRSAWITEINLISREVPEGWIE
jgi:hypothetical protein